jgi:nitrate reductase NapE component
MAASQPGCQNQPARPNERIDAMLWTLLLIVLVLWALGAVASVGGGFIHLLLLVAGIIFIAQLVTGRRTV